MIEKFLGKGKVVVVVVVFSSVFLIDESGRENISIYLINRKNLLSSHKFMRLRTDPTYLYFNAAQLLLHSV